LQFIDLKSQQDQIRSKIEKRIQKVLDHGKYIMGPEVFELEEILSDYVGVKHCISCSSGTDALLMPLMAWNIGPGDAVFTSPFTFIATAEVIRILGATPVFVDIETDTYNIDPSLLDSQIQRIIKETDLKPKAIIPVDLFGLLANYPEIMKIAQKHNLYVLEDGAQSFGGKIDESKSCSFGHAATTSFFPAKPLGCYGDGGAVFTDNDELAEKLRSIRVHGKGTHKYDNVCTGINGRLDTIQAAILLEKFSVFPGKIVKRNTAAAKYTELLDGLVIIPTIPNGYQSVWAQYSVLAENEGDRTRIQNLLKGNNIPNVVYYPKPVHLQTAYSDLKYRVGDFPISEDISARIFSLPMYPNIPFEDIIIIAETLKRGLKK